MAKIGLPGVLLLFGIVSFCHAQLYHYKPVTGVIKLDKSQADHGRRAREIEERDLGKIVNPNFIPLPKHKRHAITVPVNARDADKDLDMKKRHAITVPVNARRRRSIPQSDLKKKRLVEVDADSTNDRREERHALNERMTLRDIKRFIKSVGKSHRDIHLYRRKK